MLTKLLFPPYHMIPKHFKFLFVHSIFYPLCHEAGLKLWFIHRLLKKTLKLHLIPCSVAH